MGLVISAENLLNLVSEQLWGFWQLVYFGVSMENT